MTTPHSAHRGSTHYDDVVGVEVTIDGMLVIADRLHLMDFPVALGIRLNIPQQDLRDIVWEQVARDTRRARPFRRTPPRGRGYG